MRTLTVPEPVKIADPGNSEYPWRVYHFYSFLLDEYLGHQKFGKSIQTLELRAEWIQTAGKSEAGEEFHISDDAYGMVWGMVQGFPAPVDPRRWGDYIPFLHAIRDAKSF